MIYPGEQLIRNLENAKDALNIIILNEQEYRLIKGISRYKLLFSKFRTKIIVNKKKFIFISDVNKFCLDYIKKFEGPIRILGIGDHKIINFCKLVVKKEKLNIKKIDDFIAVPTISTYGCERNGIALFFDESDKASFINCSSCIPNHIYYDEELSKIHQSSDIKLITVATISKALDLMARNTTISKNYALARTALDHLLQMISIVTDNKKLYYKKLQIASRLIGECDLKKVEISELTKEHSESYQQNRELTTYKAQKICQLIFQE